MTKHLTGAAKAGLAQPLERTGLYPDEGDWAAHFRIKIGQRFHRTGYTAVVWRVMSVYRDAQGLEHASLVDEAGRLDVKTLSASVLLDRAQYRLI
jgi:hypothetical protein